MSDEEMTPRDDTQAHERARCETIELADDGRLRLWPHFVGVRFADCLYRWLRDVVPWEQISFGDRLEPRLTAWMASFSYCYGGVRRPPASRIELVRRLATMVEQRAFEGSPVHFDGVLLSYYRSGLDRVGLHADAERNIVAGAPIASLSLGAARRFVLRHSRTRKKVVLLLGPGSLLVMEGTTQTFWKHEVPAEPRCTAGSINLTMRMSTIR